MYGQCLRAISRDCLENGIGCQVAVTLSVANHHASLPVAYRLCLPEDWTKDQGRRRKAKVPEAIAFQTKPRFPSNRPKRPDRRGCLSGSC